MIAENRKDTRLPREFFQKDAIVLAQDLLGKILVHETRHGTIRAYITETEAYMGAEDKASHAYGNKRTSRTEPMFAIGGTAYVYLIYGMYCCMNVTANEQDIPHAVLIRKVEPADGESEQIMQSLRKVKNRKNLSDGPGKLCIAMDITREQNGLDMAVDKSFYLTEGKSVSKKQIQAGKRINIDYAEEAIDYLWRFYI